MGRPHGVHGSLWVRPTGPTLTALGRGAPVVARWRDGRRRHLEVLAVHTSGDRCRLEFSGVGTRDEAAELTGSDLCARPDALPPIEEPDTFYVRDLLGVEVHAGDRSLGPVVAVHPAPANDALEVATDGGALLIPFTADAVVALDMAARRLEIRPELVLAPED